MKILYLVNQFPELSQTFVVDEVLAMIDRGADVRVISRKRPSNPYRGADEIQKLGPITRYAEDHKGKSGGAADKLMRGAKGALGKAKGLVSSETPAPLEPAGFDRLESAVRQVTSVWKPDVVQCHFGPMGAMAAMLKKRGALPGKIATVFHGYDVTKGKDIARWNSYEQLFSLGDGFIAISGLWCRKLLDMGAPVKKIHAVKLGIDTGEFEYLDRTCKEGDPFRISSVGRMTEKKGHEYTIRAVGLIAKHSPDFNIQLDIIGDGELLDEMKELVIQQGIEHRVTLHGAAGKDRVLELLAKSNLFALHSVTAADGDKEGIPVSIMEAMAMGLPVISTRHSGIPELVKHGETGLIANERDYIAIAENICELATHPVKAKALGQKGREVVTALHERSSQSDLMFKTLKDIAEKA